MDVSENKITPKSSILIGFSIINHPFWGTPVFGNTHIPTWNLKNYPIFTGQFGSFVFLRIICAPKHCNILKVN